MPFSLEMIDSVALVAVMLCWVGSHFRFLFRKRPPKTEERKRDRAWVLGIIVQATAYSIVWGWRRPFGAAFPPEAGAWVRIALDVAAVLLGAWAVWLAAAAVIVLASSSASPRASSRGTSWRPRGRTAFVRHPIYTAMLAMLVATGFVVSRWPALLVAIVVCAVGTFIRVRKRGAVAARDVRRCVRRICARVPAVLPLRMPGA